MGVAGFVAVALILSSSSSWAANPGFRIVITSNGLNYGKREIKSALAITVHCSNSAELLH